MKDTLLGLLYAALPLFVGLTLIGLFPKTMLLVAIVALCWYVGREERESREIT